MIASPRLAATLSLLLLANVAYAANAAEAVRWPIPWKAGDTWVYETESIDHEVEDGKPKTMRTTDRTEIRVDDAGKQGYVQTWTSRDSRIEAVEGDRSSADTIAPILDQFDGYGVVVELDSDGQYRRMRNLDETTTKVRTIMMPLTGLSEDPAPIDSDDKLAKAGQEAMQEITRLNLKAMLETFFNHEKVEVMTTEHIRSFTRFMGQRFTPGKTYRDNAPLSSPTRGRPLPATREYVLDIDKDDANLARLRWTHTLDTRGDAESLWLLASELAGNAAAEFPHAGRPENLALHEEGFALFHLDTGTIDLIQTITTSRYGDTHDERERNRMRRVGATRTWAQEDAAAKH